MAAVADTHTAVWFLFADDRLSRTAKNFIDDAARTGSKIAVSSVSLAELVYLVEKGRLPQATYDALEKAFRDPESVFTEAAFTTEVVASMWQVPRAQVPDLPDRMIAAPADYLEVLVISRDGKIRSSGSGTIW